MRRGWKILLGVLVALAILLAVNTVVVDEQTKAAEETVEGGQILRLPGGDLQVYEEGSRRGSPIVLIHCYACSLHWWDRLAPILARRHRVVRVDLLGFGGSEKPAGGYSIERQAQLVATALNELGVQGAVVVGHSLGAHVATALAEQSSQLVDRLVVIDAAPDHTYGELPFLARLGYTPVIGEAMWRLTPDFAIEDGVRSAFAPGYDLESGFEDPDQVVDDFRAMTYHSYDEVAAAADDYTDAQPLDERIRGALVPLLVVFGDEDQLSDDPREAADAYSDVPGARIAMMKGAGHSPNVERPAETARLILEFAADAGDELAREHPPRRR